jgi:hypothetical protein
MSILRKGGRRTKASAAVVTGLALMAFQVLAVIGAGTAAAATACTYNPATKTINITIDPGDTAYVAVETSGNLDAEASPGAILFTDSGYDYENGAASTQCGSADVSNTVAIVVLGQPSADEGFFIDEWANDLGGSFPATIAWAIDMGSQSTAFGDTFGWWGSDTFNVVDDVVTLTDTTFDINGAAGTLLGVDSFYYFYGGGGDDVLDASAVTKYVDLEGIDGDDWLAPGSFDGDYLYGGAGFDTVSYGTRTTCTAVVNDVDAGLDANCDGDNDDVGDEEDTLADAFEGIETGSGNDTITGDAGTDEVITPGDGDDDITGNAGDDDALDYSTSSAGVVIDPANGTVTGQGTDTFTNITSFYGSDFNDTLIWDGTTVFFSGGDGVDLVDASADTAGVSIDLDTLDGTPTGGTGAPADDLENVKGGSGNDDLTGNDIRNRIDGGDGDDVLVGGAGNDRLLGGLGNDTYEGDAGADTVSFKNSPNGVTADLLAGFATGEGDDSFASPIDVEILVGSAHRDNFTGGGGVVAINFRFKGGKGNDILTGSGSNDTLGGGAGKDVLRGVGGDDTLKGGTGNDRLYGGAGVDVGRGGPGRDICNKVEIRNSCGKKGHPKRPGTAVAAKLARP